MAVKKTRRGTRTTVAKKPAAKKAAAKTILSPKAQRRNRTAKKTPVKNMAQLKKIANKAAPKKTSARKTGSKKLILSAKNQKISEKLYKMSDKKAAKFAAATKTASKKTTAKKIPKGKIGLAVAGIGTVLAGANALRNKPKSFGEAFKKARKNKGPNSTFTYKGKKYSTVTKDQIKKAGFTNLRDYLNSKKKK
jgi:hypothetical protein